MKEDIYEEENILNNTPKKEDLISNNPAVNTGQHASLIPEFMPGDYYSLSEQDIEQLKKDGYTIIE